MMTLATFRIALMIARVCVSEAGWNGHDECTAIAHAFVYQAQTRNITIERQICAYSPNSCNKNRTDRRMWISHLHPESRRAPPGWPRGMSWEEHRAKFTAMLLVAHRAYLGVLPSACPGSVHWGSHGCRACRTRMESSGFIRSHCGLANRWWRRPLKNEIALMRINPRRNRG